MMVLYEAEIVWYKQNQGTLGEEIEKVETKLIEAKDEKTALNKVVGLYNQSTCFVLWSPSQSSEMRKSNWLTGGHYNKALMPDSIGIRKPNIVK